MYIQISVSVSININTYVYMQIYIKTCIPNIPEKEKEKFED